MRFAVTRKWPIYTLQFVVQFLFRIYKIRISFRSLKSFYELDFQLKHANRSNFINCMRLQNPPDKPRAQAYLKYFAHKFSFGAVRLVVELEFHWWRWSTYSRFAGRLKCVNGTSVCYVVACQTVVSTSQRWGIMCGIR